MSKMEEFFKKAESDEAIKAELKAIFEGKKSEKLTADDIAKITELAKNQDIEAGETAELSDEDLGKISGGRIARDGMGGYKVVDDSGKTELGRYKTPEEAMKEAMFGKGFELSDEELSKVSGGNSYGDHDLIFFCEGFPIRVNEDGSFTVIIEKAGRNFECTTLHQAIDLIKCLKELASLLSL